jgi:uncharacterized membrane protein YhaH (DUF805 family)
MRAGSWDSLRLTIRHSLTFTGRSSRTDVWTYLLAAALVVAILSSVTSWATEDPASGWIALAIAVICAVPVPALAVRRLHDFGRSGWWSLALAAGAARLLLLDVLQLAFGGNVRAAAENVAYWIDWAIFPAFGLAYLALLAWPGSKRRNRPPLT